MNPWKCTSFWQRRRLESAISGLQKDQSFKDFITKKLMMRTTEFGPEFADKYMKEASSRFATQK